MGDELLRRCLVGVGVRGRVGVGVRVRIRVRVRVRVRVRARARARVRVRSTLTLTLRPRCLHHVAGSQSLVGCGSLAAGARRLGFRNRLALARRPPLRVRATRIVRAPRPSLAVAAA